VFECPSREEEVIKVRRKTKKKIGLKQKVADETPIFQAAKVKKGVPLEGNREWYLTIPKRKN